jgi:ankyrin repeat protein
LASPIFFFFFFFLVTHQVNLNATDATHGRTPLHFAAQFNRPALAKLLVQKGAMVDAVDNNGEVRGGGREGGLLCWLAESANRFFHLKHFFVVNVYF